jgi:tetratricopeptide (TPR) repeat protein
MSDDLNDIDLSAWDVPEPPDDLADCVVARLGGTDITPAIPEAAPRRRSRGLIIGGVAAAVVALSLGLWTLIGSTDRAAPMNGVVFAQFAQQLSLDGVTADLDVGANVKWTRDARSVHVQQRSGSAAWRIATDQRLVINAGSSTVEASGKSSLRVEVKMNKVERAVGASAFAAAAIVTVIVYNGKVTVENPKHERIVVAPGTTYNVEPSVDEQLLEERTVGVAPPVDVTTCDEVSCVLTNYEGACCVRYNPTKDTLDQADIDGAIALVRDDIVACGDQYTTTGQVVLTVRVADSKVDMVKVTSTPDVALGQCVADVVKSAVFPAANNLVTFTVPFVFPAPKVTCDAKAARAAGDQAMAKGKHAEALAQYEASLRCKQDPDVVLLAGKAACKSNNAAKAKLYKVTCNACDANELKDKGMEEVNMGEHGKALALFEQSLTCKHDGYVVALAFMAACNTQDATKARLYYGQLTPAQQSKFKVMCDRNHVDLSSTCDADALKDKGMENVNMGQHAAALAQFEASLRCKQDGFVVSLAFIASCNAKNEAKARQYFGQLTPAQQSKYKVMCIRNGIDVVSACDADALKDSGMEKINMGAHADALALFEQSLACKDDPYVEQLAFMEACNSRNATKARAYYAKLTPAQQGKFEMICTRNKVDLFDTSGDPKGYLQVFSQPEARIFIDGVDTGLSTPIQGKALALTPGKHKVTFAIDSHRFTFPVVTKSGQTDTMTKDLQ